MNKGYSKAFTIAELLITLAIIGVVAAFTIRSVVVNTNKLVTETRLKRTYAELSHALDMGSVKNGLITEAEFGTTEVTTQIFPIYFAPNLKIAKTCTSWEDCGYNNTGSNKSPWKKMTNSLWEKNAAGSGKSLVQLQTGAVIFFEAWTTGADGIRKVSRSIWVDLDGPKGYNKMGKDVFCFTIDFKTGKLVPQIYIDGNKMEMDKIKEKCKNHGITCSAWIAKSGWKIPDGYPW